MEKSRVVWTFFLVFSVLLVAVGFSVYVNTQGNPVLVKTVDLLDQANGEPTLQLKLADVAQALKTYQSGSHQSNLQGLIVLNMSSSIEQFNYTFPTVKSDIQNENAFTLFSAHAIMQVILFIAWIVTNADGTFDNYDTWSNGEKHFYIALQAVLIVALIVSIIP